jgi:hypothetical protein
MSFDFSFGAEAKKAEAPAKLKALTKAMATPATASVSSSHTGSREEALGIGGASVATTNERLNQMSFDFSFGAEAKKAESPKEMTKQASTSSVGSTGSTGHNRKAMALKWCRVLIAGSGQDVSNFGSSFGDGLVFCAVMAALFPHTISLAECTAKDRRGRFKAAFDAAASAGQDPLLEVEDMVAVPYPDDISCQMQVLLS